MEKKTAFFIQNNRYLLTLHINQALYSVLSKLFFFKPSYYRFYDFIAKIFILYIRKISVYLKKKKPVNFIKKKSFFKYR